MLVRVTDSDTNIGLDPEFSRIRSTDRRGWDRDLVRRCRSGVVGRGHGAAAGAGLSRPGPGQLFTARQSVAALGGGGRGSAYWKIRAKSRRIVQAMAQYRRQLWTDSRALIVTLACPGQPPAGRFRGTRPGDRYLAPAGAGGPGFRISECRHQLPVAWPLPAPLRPAEAAESSGQ